MLAGALTAALLSASPEARALAQQALQLEASDSRGALALYERACALKHQAACAQVALLIAPDDATRAFQLAEASCKANEALACAVEAIFWLRGVGCSKDETRALRKFERACEAGLLTACGPDTRYEFEGPARTSRFTTDRSAIPPNARWRVFKGTVPKDLSAIRFTGRE